MYTEVITQQSSGSECGKDPSDKKKNLLTSVINFILTSGMYSVQFSFNLFTKLVDLVWPEGVWLLKTGYNSSLKGCRYLAAVLYIEKTPKPMEIAPDKVSEKPENYQAIQHEQVDPENVPERLVENEYQKRKEEEKRKREEKLMNQENAFKLKCAEMNKQHKQKIRDNRQISESKINRIMKKHEDEEKYEEEQRQIRLQQKTRKNEEKMKRMNDESKQFEQQCQQNIEKTRNDIQNTQRLIEETRQQFERESEESKEKLRIELENSQKMQEENKKQHEKRMDEINELIKQKIWNFKLENYFTEKLEYLRKSYSEISRSYYSFESELNMAGTNMQIVNSTKQKLKNEIENEKKLMEKAYNLFEEQINTNRWWYFENVKNNIEKVIISCIEFKKLLNEMDLNHLDIFIQKLNEANRDIMNKCIEIPTFESIKRAFSQQNNQPQSSNLAIQYQTKLSIEEVEENK